MNYVQHKITLFRHCVVKLHSILLTNWINNYCMMSNFIICPLSREKGYITKLQSMYKSWLWCHTEYNYGVCSRSDAAPEGDGVVWSILCIEWCNRKENGVCGHSQTGVKQQAARSARDELVIGICVVSTLTHYIEIGLIFCLLSI